MAPDDSSRLVRIEMGLVEISGDLADLKGELHGDARTSWERSVQGKLHKLQSEAAAALVARETIAELRAQRETQTTQLFTRRQIILGSAIALFMLAIALTTLAVTLFTQLHHH